MAADFGQHCREIARRFLLNAVVVDDEPYFDNERVGRLQAPGRKRDGTASDAQAMERQTGRQSLDARAITESFAEQGMICGIIVPYGRNGDGHFFDAVRRADVVVIDWQLHDDRGETAVALLKFILREEESYRLRLIAIYTGDTHLDRIASTISKRLEASGIALQSDAHTGPGVELSHGHCRVALYAKPGTGLSKELSARSVSEQHLAERLIHDFADLVEGLLPSIALTALAAVRENTHKVLDRFETRLGRSVPYA